MVERILLQDRELWSQPGFAYATKTNNTGRNQGRRSYSPTSYKMASKMTLLQPVLGAGAQSNRQLKYEIIERLLRTPDTDVTSRTLKEMMNLYQELLDKNLSDKSSVQAQNPPQQ